MLGLCMYIFYDMGGGGSGEWRGIGGTSPWKIEGISFPPGWKSVGMSPLWKNFKSIIFFLSTHKWPEFEIIPNPGGGGAWNFQRAAPRKSPPRENVRKLSLPNIRQTRLKYFNILSAPPLQTLPHIRTNSLERILIWTWATYFWKSWI